MSRRPFSLAAYLAFARGRPGTGSHPPMRAARPEGPLLWMHADSAEASRALMALFVRLQFQRPELTLLLTGNTTAAPESALTDALPEDTPSAVQGFVDHWRPTLGFWTGSALRPALIAKLREGGTKLAILNVADEPFSTPAPLWIPDPSAACLALFDRIFAQDEAALRRLRRLGLPDTGLENEGPLTETAPPLDCSHEQHQECAAILAGRPVWLAARLRADEAEDVLRAHRRAVRLAHRLLLIMVPATETDGQRIAETARASDLRLCNWDAGETLDENTQVLLTEDASSLGLWYRLAPVAFLGGSLVPGVGGEDPLEAAGHGTAILYGPNVGRHLSAYSRLVTAGAARIVRDFDSLAAAVSQLIAPDRAAAMAHAGWDVVSQGAALTDRLTELTAQWLDGEESAE